MRQINKLDLENIVKIKRIIRFFKEKHNHNLCLLHRESFNFNQDYKQINLYYKN